ELLGVLALGLGDGEPAAGADRDDRDDEDQDAIALAHGVVPPVAGVLAAAGAAGVVVVDGVEAAGVVPPVAAVAAADAPGTALSWTVRLKLSGSLQPPPPPPPVELDAPLSVED